MFISWFWYLYLGYVNLPTLETGRRAYVNSLSYSCNFPSVQNYLKIKHVCFKVLNHRPQRIQREDWVTVTWRTRKRATGHHCWPETLNWLCFTQFQRVSLTLFTYSLVSIRWKSQISTQSGPAALFHPMDVFYSLETAKIVKGPDLKSGKGSTHLLSLLRNKASKA